MKVSKDDSHKQQLKVINDKLTNAIYWLNEVQDYMMLLTDEYNETQTDMVEHINDSCEELRVDMDTFVRYNKLLIK